MALAPARLPRLDANAKEDESAAVAASARGI
jgi:hypothetical protein